MPKGVVEDPEPEDKKSSAYYNWLKRESARQLRKSGYNAPDMKQRTRIKNSFNKPDESRIRTINSKVTYWEWLELNTYPDEDGVMREPLAANPDLWEEID